ncbi:hypothetical protein BG004_008344 [Podila humilis]|nr:hypothetical protein BG004_008344 [Podila humilis]
MSPNSLHILIVGAGVSGLFFALLLEHAKINYTVIERQSEALYNQHGTLQLTSNSMAIIDQLGLLSEYMAVAKVTRSVSIYKSDLQLVGHFPTLHHESRFGYPSTVVSKMVFCRLILSKIPANRIRWKQHIIEIVHGDSGVSVHCTDSSSPSKTRATTTTTTTSISSATTTSTKLKRQGYASFEEDLSDLREFGLHPTLSHSQLARGRSISTSNQYYGPSYNTHVQYRAYAKTKPWSPLRRVRYDGDILIGADGAYSQVRQSLYERMAVIRRKIDLERVMEKVANKRPMPDPVLCRQQRHERRAMRKEGTSVHAIRTGKKQMPIPAYEQVTLGSECLSMITTVSSTELSAPYSTGEISLRSGSHTLVTASNSGDPPFKDTNVTAAIQTEMLRRSKSLGDLGCGGGDPIDGAHGDSNRDKIGYKPVPPRRTSSRPSVSRADKLPLRVTEIAVAGITEPLSHDTFPEAAGRFADVKLVGDKDCNYAVFATSLSNNSVMWSVVGPVTHSGKTLDGNFGQSQWCIEMAEELMHRCRDIKSPYGGVLGDLFDRTPKTTIGKHMIEEKLFNTWYYGRTCLMGDGLAGESAIADAACLASMIKHLPTSPSSGMITRAFECYREQRYSQVRIAMYWSREFGRTIIGKSLVSDLVRKAFCKIPKWAQNSLLLKIYYPKILNVPFLPRVILDNGTSHDNGQLVNLHQQQQQHRSAHRDRIQLRIETWDSQKIVHRIRGNGGDVVVGEDQMSVCSPLQQVSVLPTTTVC